MSQDLQANYSFTKPECLAERQHRVTALDNNGGCTEVSPRQSSLDGPIVSRSQRSHCSVSASQLKDPLT